MTKMESNGLVLLEDKNQEAATDKSVSAHCSQLTHYLSLLCFLLIIISLMLTLCLVQITLMFRSQSTLQENKVKNLKNQLDKLNQSYHFLFSQYPALNQYCPITNTNTAERRCSVCLDGWELHGDKCFLFSQDRRDWISSQYHCMALGGAVATVRSAQEQVFLWKQAQSLSQGDSYWLGLRSSGADGGWRWSDGSSLDDGPQFWEREPEQQEEEEEKEEEERCGRLSPGDDAGKSWFTSSCSNHLRSICERRRAALQ